MYRVLVFWVGKSSEQSQNSHLRQSLWLLGPVSLRASLETKRETLIYVFGPFGPNNNDKEYQQSLHAMVRTKCIGFRNESHIGRHRSPVALFTTSALIAFVIWACAYWCGDEIFIFLYLQCSLCFLVSAHIQQWSVMSHHLQFEAGN